jgi:hypothetical protein
MHSLSFVPRIYLFLLLEYLPVFLLRPFLSYRPRFFTNSSPFPSSSSTYQRTDRRRHSTSDLFRIFRWSSCPPQRHAYPTLRWKRTFFFSHSLSSLRLSFLPLFTIIAPSCAADAPPPVPLRCQHGAGASPPSGPNLHVSHSSPDWACSAVRLTSATASLQSSLAGPQRPFSQSWYCSPCRCLTRSGQPFSRSWHRPSCHRRGRRACCRYIQRLFMAVSRS